VRTFIFYGFLNLSVPRIPDEFIPKQTEEAKPKEQTEEDILKQTMSGQDANVENKKKQAARKGKKEIVRVDPSIARNEALNTMRIELSAPSSTWNNRHKFPKPKPNQTVIFYSSAGRRSDHATKLAVEMGYNAKSLLGGSRLWNKYNDPTNPSVPKFIKPSSTPIEPIVNSTLKDGQ